MKSYRQGDVLIEAIAKIPKDAQRQKSANRIVLALGEATGHHHALETTDDPADWWKCGDEQYVTLAQPARLTHQEHAIVELPVGTFRVTRQREYTPEAIRNVAD